MERKILCALLVLLLIASFALGGCGQKPDEPAKPAQPADQVIELKFSHAGQEAETEGVIVKAFCDYVEQKSGGKVKIERFPGGVLGGPQEQLKLVGSGSVDMAVFGHLGNRDELTLLNFPPWIKGSPEAVMDFFNKIIYENPQTAKLIEDEAKANGVKYLGFTLGGSNVFINKTSFNALDELKGKKFGAGGAQAAFAALGLKVVNMFPPDGYESLSRGVVEATQMGFAPTISLKWYEVAKGYMFDGTYACGSPITINLKTWESLPADVQQIMMDGVKEAVKLSFELDKAARERDVKLLEANGVTVGTLSEADQQKWFDLLYEECKKEMLERTTKQGKAEQAKIILDYADSLLKK